MVIHCCSPLCSCKSQIIALSMELRPLYMRTSLFGVRKSTLRLSFAFRKQHSHKHLKNLCPRLHYYSFDLQRLHKSGSLKRVRRVTFFGRFTKSHTRTLSEQYLNGSMALCFKFVKNVSPVRTCVGGVRRQMSISTTDGSLRCVYTCFFGWVLQEIVVV